MEKLLLLISEIITKKKNCIIITMKRITTVYTLFLGVN